MKNINLYSSFFYLLIMSFFVCHYNMAISEKYGDQALEIDISTSTYPTTDNQLTRLGYIPSLNTEVVLGLQQDLIIADKATELQKETELLKNAGIDTFFVESTNILDNPIKEVNIIGNKLGNIAFIESLEYQSPKMKLHSID